MKSECGKISLAHHLRHFDKYIVCSGCTEITESVITVWIETLSNLSDVTKNNYICDVQGLLIFINTWKRIHYFIPSLIKEDDLYVPHLFSDEEKHRFYERIDNYEPGVAIKLPWIRAELPMVIRICDGCGTRISASNTSEFFLLAMIKYVPPSFRQLKTNHESKQDSVRTVNRRIHIE